MKLYNIPLKYIVVIACSCFVFMSMNAQKSKISNGCMVESITNFFKNYNVLGYVPSNNIKCDSVVSCSDSLKIYANESFFSQPISPQVVNNVYFKIRQIISPEKSLRKLCILNSKGRKFESFIPNYFRSSIDSSRVWNDFEYVGSPWVKNISENVKNDLGLKNRHLFVWASHGLYAKENKWVWQRPKLFCTCEDLLTQSFVYPFLIPMLQNAGAVVYTPRERDWQIHEVIVDNDGYSDGDYEEKAEKYFNWNVMNSLGFSNKYEIIHDKVNPFEQGTSRYIATTKVRNKPSIASWIPNIPKTGNYAVYVSYANCEHNISDALYTVVHGGVKTDFLVNQTMGEGTWVYLGTFKFIAGKNKKNCVILSNVSNQKGFVTADAIKLGGGMGNVVRKDTISNYPRFAEGARYWAIWAGMPYEVYSSKNGKDDYADDINARSYSLNYIGGKSFYIPSTNGLKVPFELSLAVHSDAGVKTNNEIFGSLSIYTANNSEGDTIFANGKSRFSSSDFTNILLGNLSYDLSKLVKTRWTRRELWNRNYSETRNPEVPSGILEMFSHQNFTDMRYAHDPLFKFSFSRSVYKSILQFCSFQHGQKDYLMQPLPIFDFSARISSENNKVLLTWKEQIDSLNSNACPTGYVVYTRIGDMDFDNGVYVTNNSVSFVITPGILYSYKICAVNEGGKSFPSEILSVYKSTDKKAKKILIVNGFTRLSGPSIVERNDSLGFDINSDIGVPYLKTVEYCGKQQNFFSASSEWGASGNELSGQIIPGNTFDFVYEHGKSIVDLKKYSFSSISRESFIHSSILPKEYPIIDFIQGQQRFDENSIGYYKTYDYICQQQMKKYCEAGGNIFVSGSYIASDMMDSCDRIFIEKILKYKFGGVVHGNLLDSISDKNINIPYYSSINSEHYAATSSDCILPSKKAFTLFKYSNGCSAGIVYQGNKYNVVALGFPFECISSETAKTRVMNKIIRLLVKSH